ncbi:hypothetical protein ACFV1N_13945 [Streptosporangium canum]|uniref:hypothetical protein n=1 Tax=Streptosporangium canum TaxID=324952 RepID=UPI00368BBAB3
MTEPSCLTATRASYVAVAVAVAYAECYGNALASMPLTRAMPAAFAELVAPSRGGVSAGARCQLRDLTSS